MMTRGGKLITITALNTVIQVDGVQDIQQLTFVLVDTFDLDIEHHAGVDK